MNLTSGPRPGHPPGHHLAPCLLALLLLGGWLPAAAQRMELRTVPHPDTAALEPAVADEIERARAAMERAPDNAAPWAALGAAYLTYELTEAAEGALANAVTLAPEDIDSAYYLGLLLQRQGRFDEAAERFRQALEVDPGDAPSRIRLAETLFEAGDLGAAREAFAEAAGHAETEAAAMWGLGRIAASEGEAVGAVARFERVLELQPQADTVRHPLGLAYRDLGRTDAARRELAAAGQVPVRFADPRAARLVPGGAAAALRRGVQAATSERWDLAERQYREAVALAPEDPAVHRHLAGALMRLGRVEEAIEEYETTLRLDPDIARSHLALGDALTRREGPSEAALASLRRATELDPDLFAAQLHLGEVALRAGRPAVALDPLRRAVELDPQSRFARLGLSRALARTGDGAAAEAQLRRLLEIDPGDANATAELAPLLLSGGRPEEAAAVVETGLAAVEEGPQREALRIVRGDLHMAAGDLPAAVEEYRRALQVVPDQSRAWFNLGTALARLGRPDEAAEALEQAVAGGIEDPTAELALAVARLEAERWRDARGGLEEAVAGGRATPPLRNLLARLLATCPDDSVRDGERALELASELLAETPTPGHAETVAMALAELGRFEEAAALQEQLLAQVEAAGHDELTPPIRARLERYRRGDAERRGWR